METKDYFGLAGFAILAAAAFIIGIATDNKFVLIAGYIFIVMTQIAYLIAYTKTIKRDLESIKQILAKN